MLRFVCLIVVICACGVYAGDFEDPGMKSTNSYRAKHKSPAVSLDKTLNANAATCATHYGKIGKIDHSCKSKDGAGENLYSSSWSGGKDKTCKELTQAAVKAWYDEISMYDFNKPTGFSAATGHFTQLVWKATTTVGFGCVVQAHPTKAGWKSAYVVGLYKVAGNVNAGKGDKNVYFKENVLPATA